MFHTLLRGESRSGSEVSPREKRRAAEALKKDDDAMLLSPRTVFRGRASARARGFGEVYSIRTYGFRGPYHPCIRTIVRDYPQQGNYGLNDLDDEALPMGKGLNRSRSISDQSSGDRREHSR